MSIIAVDFLGQFAKNAEMGLIASKCGHMTAFFVDNKRDLDITYSTRRQLSEHKSS